VHILSNGGVAKVGSHSEVGYESNEGRDCEEVVEDSFLMGSESFCARGWRSVSTIIGTVVFVFPRLVSGSS
jgi:hypothetical protein